MQKDFVVRTQSDYANKYSLGELVIPGVALFRADRINLTKPQLDRAVTNVRAAGGRIVGG